MASKPSSALVIIFIFFTVSSSLVAKEENIVFYMHDIAIGENITAVVVAGLNGTYSNILGFGTVIVVDDVLTEGPDPSSQVLGRAQGLYVNADVKGTSMHMAFSVFFEKERYNGSSLAIQGTDRFGSGAPSDVSVVGETGLFRYARGYSSLQTVGADGLSVVIKFNATVRSDKIRIRIFTGTADLSYMHFGFQIKSM